MKETMVTITLPIEHIERAIASLRIMHEKFASYNEQHPDDIECLLERLELASAIVVFSEERKKALEGVSK